ncbi:hypothetical protein OKA05_10805 [Luteolibacter arcticus]|uniref:Major facilitator superfamily (MFS) profile domain-containing protein n=1 Tax=Luteolibacter arcticus TaxID=1581411 RepID=A0ABT3GHQ1_9BACT|nr:hypothetical protein [Luteolibacter arcticus]MCW1923043.1 hypothetical protein [Luteolibacter arcticus]
MAIVSLILAAIVLFLIGAGIAVGLVACGLAALLVGLGMISSSVIVGIHSGRTTDGIRAFLLQCGIIAGVPAGAISALLATSLIAELKGVVDWPVLIYGALGGALAGIMVALALDLMSRRLHAWAALRLTRVTGADVKAAPGL